MTELWLNLGCGQQVHGRSKRLKREGVELVNHDRRLHSPHVDVAHDLRQFPWPWEDESFDGIEAFDIVEHLPDTLVFMDECWRILRPGGEIIIHTNNAAIPASAWRDPTHIQAFTIESFDFFDPDTIWGTHYGQWYTDRNWRLVKRQHDVTELLFVLRKRVEEHG